LRRLQEMLDLLYGANSSLELSPANARGAYVCLTLPSQPRE
jgi:hypothetical protein